MFEPLKRISYFKAGNYVSFFLISYFHIKELRKNFDVREGIVNILGHELAFKRYLRDVDLAIVHPCLYPFAFGDYQEYYVKFFNTFNKSIGIDTADSNKVNPKFKKLLDSFTRLIVPSEWAKKAYLKTRTKTPIHILPHGLDEAFFQPKISVPRSYVLQRLQQNPKTKILFFYIHSEWRKGIDLIEKIAPKIPNTLWVMKSMEGGAKPNIPNLFVITGQQSWSELVEIYDICDILFLPSRGEGFGLNVLEALARGLPVLYPEKSAMSEYAHGYGVEIKAKALDQPLPDNLVHIVKGHTIDLEDAVNKINMVIKDLNYYKNLASKFPRERYGWGKIGEQLTAIISRTLA